MKTITLRDLPEDVALRITERARKTGASLNKTVIDMLTEAEPVPKKRLHRDLDHLAGSWSNEEADELASFLDSQRVVDAEMWK